MNDETDLIKKLNGVKFDAIVSVDLFNGGSGGEVPKDDLIENKYSVHDWFNYFILHAQRLLKERGCQVHLGAETLPYQMHMALSRKEEIAKGKFTLDSFGNYSADRGMNQTIKDMISSGKLELDPIGHQNVIVKK